MQEEMFELPPLQPTWPRPNTLQARLLEMLVEGGTPDHPEFERHTMSWRLAAVAHQLRTLGWPVQTLPVPAPTPENPARVIARYWLDKTRLAEVMQAREADE